MTRGRQAGLPLRPPDIIVPEGSHVSEMAMLEVAAVTALVISLGWWMRICAADRERARLRRGSWRRQVPPTRRRRR